MHRFHRTPLIRTLPFIAAGLASLIGAAVAAEASPVWIAAVVRPTGMTALLPVLGTMQGLRVVAMIAAALLVAGFVWSSLYLLFGHGGALVRKGKRARAAVWGAGLEPFPEEERRLPRDLDQPLAAFDPDALPVVPLQPVPTPSPPQLCAAKGVREEEQEVAAEDAPATPPDPAEAPVDLLPIANLRSGEPPRLGEDAITYLRSVDLSNNLSSFGKRSAPTPAAEEPGAEPSIAALLARLERGAAGMKQG
ncbi:hypothetical protein [Sphingomonas abaci]|uniref:Uncharacterized protein n=1 Tax=Sphingomonas abaci TaxID=237611 RepID=A0A7W7AHJ7_9SPHN|nr:hypothetical protein [Sphingomonas abaci]MBB4616182.1 hypothetical protein [Sphingomonas abaci]